MDNDSFDIVFDLDGKHYEGWVTPSVHLKEDGSPKSFHVVLDDVLFGNISHDNNTWVVDEQRPENLTAAVGKFIQDIY